MRRIAIIQPSFLPWLGYFEQMARADVFVHFDNVQYTRKDWRNRNRLKSPAGVKHVTVPVGSHEYGLTPINEVPVGDVPEWRGKLVRQIEGWYAKAPYFDTVFPEFRNILLAPTRLLVDLNYALTDALRHCLGIETPQHRSSDIPGLPADKNLKIIAICRHHRADLLYDGKAAQSFIDVDLFARHGVKVIFQEYEHSPYPQLWGPFQSHLSALDLLLNCGPASRGILLSSPVSEELHGA